MSKRTRLVLIVSLVLNLFLIGGLIGAALMWQRSAAEQPAAAGLGRPALRQAAMVLHPEHRRALRAIVRDIMRENRPEIRKARAARQDVATLLAEPRLDPAAFDAAILRAREADMRVRIGLEAGISRFVRGLPDDQRIAFGQALVRANQEQRERRRQRVAERAAEPAP